MSVICSELLNENIPFASQNYAHLNGLELADCSKTLVKRVDDMLIGLDYYYLFIIGESIREKQSEPIALKSIFGWIICGYFRNPDEVNTNLNITHMYRVNTDVLENYKEDTEMLQTILLNKYTEVEECHKTDVLSNFEKSLEFDEENKRYKVKLPFNAEYDFLPDNVNVAKNSLLNLKQKLLKMKTYRVLTTIFLMNI